MSAIFLLEDIIIIISINEMAILWLSLTKQVYYSGESFVWGYNCDKDTNSFFSTLDDIDNYKEVRFLVSNVSSINFIWVRKCEFNVPTLVANWFSKKWLGPEIHLYITECEIQKVNYNFHKVVHNHQLLEIYTFKVV